MSEDPGYAKRVEAYTAQAGKGEVIKIADIEKALKEPESNPPSLEVLPDDTQPAETRQSPANKVDPKGRYDRVTRAAYRPGEAKTDKDLAKEIGIYKRTLDEAEGQKPDGDTSQ